MPARRLTSSAGVLQPRHKAAGRNGTDTDRSALPKASVSFSRGGTPKYGLQDRPLVRALRYEFEASKAAQNIASIDRQMSNPQGVRHKGYHNHVQALRQAGESEEKEAQLKAERMRRGFQKLQTSADNPLNGLGADGKERFSPPPSKVGHRRSPHPCDSPPAQPINAAGLGRKSPLLQHETSEENPFWKGSDGASQRTPSAERYTPENRVSEGGGGASPVRVPTPYPSRHGARLEFESSHHGLEVMERPPGRATVDPDWQGCRAQKAGDIEKTAMRQYPHGVPRHTRRQLGQHGAILPPIGFGLGTEPERGVITRS